MKTMRFLAVTAVFAVTFPVPVMAQDVASKCASHQILFEGLRDARSRLTSGVCRGTGHRQLRESMEGESSFFLAFDYLDHRIRSDRIDPIIFIDSAAQVETVKQIGYQLVQTPEKTLYLDLGAGLKTTDILSVAAPDFSPPKYGLPIDVRTFGLVDWASITDGATFEKTVEALDKCNVQGVRREPDGRCVVSVLPVDNVRVELWINADAGFTVERSEMRTLEAPDKWSKVLITMDVTWEQKNDVWVPTSLYLEREFSGRETYLAKLEWESVNAAPATDHFEPKGFGLAPESIIVDDRLGSPPVVIGKIEDGGRAPIPAAVNVPHHGSRLVWLLAGNAIGLTVIGIIYIWRRRRHVKIT